MLKGVHITVTGNPMTSLPSMKIVNSACSVIMKAHPELSTDQCLNGVLMTSLSSSLGVNPDTLDPFRTLSAAEQFGAVTAASNPLNICLSDIQNLDPNSAQVKAAYNPASFDPFSGVGAMIPGNSNGCPEVYRGSTYANPTPTPPPPGTTLVDFDHPVPPGQSYSAVSGVFQGIDFGDSWQWEAPFNADTSNHIYPDTGGTNLGSFTFSGGSQILDSISLFTTKAGDFTISDDTGESVTRHIEADVNMHTIATGFANPTSTITISGPNLFSLGVDDITFHPPANPAPIAYVQGFFDFYTGSSHTTSLRSDTKAGDLIVVQVQWTLGISLINVKDSQGNTYASAMAPGIGPSGMNRQQIWFAKNIKGGPLTVNVSFGNGGGANYSGVYIYEYSGLDATNPLDATSSVSGSSSSVACGAVSTHFANELIFAGIESEFDTSFQPDTGLGFTSRSVKFNSVPTADKVVTSLETTTLTGTATTTGNLGWNCQMVTFKSKN